MDYAARLWRWYVRLAIAQAQKQQRRVKKMERALKWVGIPTLPPPMTQREMMVRSTIVWSALGIVFFAIYWALR
jgi:hypothetical protein